jgi:hypothetical protein
MHQNSDHDSSWQQPPAISGGMPFTLQMLSTGAGDLLMIIPVCPQLVNLRFAAE